MPTYKFDVGDAAALPLPDKSVDLVVGSPPYLEARTYGIAAERNTYEWVAWMLACTKEALRISKGPVIWICAGTGSTNYLPGPEGLIYEAYRANLPLLRPCMWEANKPPSGRKWFTNVLEYCVCFGALPLPHFDVTPIATPMKYTNGGAFRQRNKHGDRVAGSTYPQHKIRKTAPNSFYTQYTPYENAGELPNKFTVPVGGGLMGHPLATENEAPYPEGVPERFILTCTKSGNTVCDPFSGSGTTIAVAVKNGRNGIGYDIRESQVELSYRRVDNVVNSMLPTAIL